jgi:uncharacterized membrane protein
MRKHNEDLQHQYRAAVDEAARRYRAGRDSLNDGYRTARDSYQHRKSGRGNGNGTSVLGVLALAAVAGAAAVAAAPHIRRMLDEQSGEDNGAKDDGAKDVGATITIDRPAEDLYDRWRRFEDFDDFMPDVIRVESTGDGMESDWTVRGPGGQELEFHSRITEDQPGRTIAWESNDQPASHKGRVTFEETGDQTRVRLELQLHPPAGAIGAAIGRMIGKATSADPKQQAERALRRFKRLMESEGASNGLGSGMAHGQPL